MSRGISCFAVRNKQDETDGRIHFTNHRPGGGRSLPRNGGTASGHRRGAVDSPRERHGARRRGAAAHRRAYGAHGGDGFDRRAAAAHAGYAARPYDFDARGRSDQRAPDERHGREHRRHARARPHGRGFDPPRASEVRRTGHLAGGALHGHQGHRPPGTLCQGRQNRSVRRRGRGQDGAHHGADQQHRQGP